MIGTGVKSKYIGGANTHSAPAHHAHDSFDPEGMIEII